MDKILKVVQEMGQHSKEYVLGFSAVCVSYLRYPSFNLNMNCDYQFELLFLSTLKNSVV